MAYTINGIDIADYGMLPGRAPGSNLALSGWLDMPARIEKTMHSWANENGVEPWLETELMFWGGRDLDFYVLINGEDEAGARDYITDCYTELDSSQRIFLNSPYGYFRCRQRDQITVKYLGIGWCQAHIPLREISPIINGTVPDADTDNLLGVDRIKFSTLGIVPLELAGRYSRAALKEINVVDFGTESTQLTNRAEKVMTFKGVFEAETLAAIKVMFSSLVAILKQPSLRRIKMQDDATREFFNTEGFRVTQINVGGTVTAMLEMNIIEDGVVPDAVDWILDGGVWDDAAIWIDESEWIDSIE